VECFLQYLDDLDDLYGMVGLIRERIRRSLKRATLFGVLLLTAVAGFWLAMVHAPIALATSTLLFVTLMYRSVTSPAFFHPESA
jgi:hypothetical protein